MNEMISVEGLSKKFTDIIALNNVSFSVSEGEILGFLGPSGAGKTTTINILTGQLSAERGTARILGKNVAEIVSTDLSKIGIVSDTSGYYEKLTLYKNLVIYAKIFGLPQTRVDELLKQVDLFESKDKIVEKLSTGMKQRMLLARALINEPKLLFLDEPTSGLDPTTSKKIHELLLLLKSKGTTIFLTTHDMNEASLLCDQLLLLSNGKIIESGSPQEIIKKHNHQKKFKIVFNDGSSETMPFDFNNSKLQELKDNIFSIHSCEPTLEEIFINLTGEKLDVQ